MQSIRGCLKSSLHHAPRLMVYSSDQFMASAIRNQQTTILVYTATRTNMQIYCHVTLQLQHSSLSASSGTFEYSSLFVARAYFKSANRWCPQSRRSVSNGPWCHGPSERYRRCRPITAAGHKALSPVYHQWHGWITSVLFMPTLLVMKMQQQSCLVVVLVSDT